MMPVDPHNRGSRKNRSGFTIFEILMVLAVMGIAVTLFVANVDNALDSVAKRSTVDVLFAAIRDARLMSVTEKKPLSLQFDHEAGNFLLFDHEGEVVGQYALDERDKDYVDDIVVWPVKASLFESNRGRRRFEVADQVVTAMQFAPTGVSSFVAFEIVYDTSVSDSQWILVDPFSNGEFEGGLE